jgi:Na+-transporting methylmalonyl-CoA/oxaloacetate decarboxylase gamma subunit
MTPPLIALAGVSVVMTVMTLLVGILYFLKAVSRRQAVSAAAAAETAVPDGEVPPELVAVLAAAAHAAVGRPVVVRRINVLRPASQENWSRVGRIDLLRSHRVDPKR